MDCLRVRVPDVDFHGGDLADSVRCILQAGFKAIEAHQSLQVGRRIGGGRQERLALMLRARLSYPGIACLGAAIALLPRYWDALALAPLNLRYRDRLPKSR